MAAETSATRELFLGEGSSADGTQNLYVNMGPAHPAMHGIIRIFAELDGEMVVKTDVEIGYLHRAFEKDCEVGPYNNADPLHGPAQLRLAAHQQLRLLLGGREAARHRDHRALQVHPRDHERDLADLRPPDVRGRRAPWSWAPSPSSST